MLAVLPLELCKVRVRVKFTLDWLWRFLLNLWLLFWLCLLSLFLSFVWVGLLFVGSLEQLFKQRVSPLYESPARWSAYSRDCPDKHELINRYQVVCLSSTSNVSDNVFISLISFLRASLWLNACSSNAFSTRSSRCSLNRFSLLILYSDVSIGNHLSSFFSTQLITNF